MFEIRPMDIDEISFALQQTKREQWTDIYCDWHALVTYQPQAAFVAEKEGKLVGMVSAVAYDSFGFIGGLIVPTEHRNRGIGRRLLSFAIEYLESHNVPLIMLDGVEKAVPLYEKLGFQVICKSLRFKDRIEGEPSSLVRRMDRKDLPDVYSMDYDAFRADRTHFIENIWTNFPELCFVIEKKQEIRGYAMGSKRDGLVRLGPLICEGGIDLVVELLKHFASVAKEKVRMGVLEKNRDGIKILEGIGFKQSGYSFRMGRGNLNGFKTSSAHYVIGSPAKG